MDGVLGCSANSHHPLVSRNPTNSSNTTPSAAGDSLATGHVCKSPMFRRLSATRKTTRFWQRDAKCNAAGDMHRAAWRLQKPRGTRKKCDIPREKHCFAAEDKGFEPLELLPAVLQKFQNSQTGRCMLIVSKGLTTDLIETLESSHCL